MFHWLNENQGAVLGIAAIVTAALTATLIWVAWRSLRAAAGATDAAREANLITARGFFGASLIVYPSGVSPQKYVVENLGAAPGHDLEAHLWVDGKQIMPVEMVSNLAPRRSPGEGAHYLGSERQEFQIPAVMPGFLPNPASRDEGFRRDAKVIVRYTDQYGEQEAASPLFDVWQR